MNKQCEKDKIINPLTGRCVKKTGKIGINICNDEIINPKTGRLVKKTGKIGRELMNQKSAVPVEVMKKIEYIIGDCDWKRLWKKRKLVGRGSVGCVYSACGKDGCDYVIKIQKDDEEFRTEVDILSRINGWVHGPKIYGVWKCGGMGYIVEEKLVKLKYTKAVSLDKIYNILGDLHKKYRIVFPDAHSGNIMMRKDGTIVLIDFGWAVYFKTKKTKINEDNWLTERLGRSVTIDEMILWETDNLTEEFGTKLQSKLVRDKLYKIK